MPTPIDRLKKKYGSSADHLSAITQAVMEQFSIPEEQRPQVRKAVDAAWSVGRNTITTDDWCNFW